MKQPLSTLVIVFLAVTSSLGAGCSDKAAASATSAAASDATPAAKGPAYPAAAQASVDETLAAYEEARAIFAADNASGIEPAAQKLAASATKAVEGAPAAAKAHLQGILDAAQKLGLASKEGIEPARKAYGEVSKHVIGLLVAFPSLTEGRFVFQCPMATGYKKWVQTSEQLSNPYMGQRMLACGGATDWKV